MQSSAASTPSEAWIPEAHSTAAHGAGGGVVLRPPTGLELFGADEAAIIRQALQTPPEHRGPNTPEGSMACAAVQKLLGRLDFFHGVPPAELEQWAHACEYRRVARGSDIPDAGLQAGATSTDDEREEAANLFAAGDRDVSTFYLILTGRVALASSAQPTSQAAAGPSAEAAAEAPAKVKTREGRRPPAVKKMPNASRDLLSAPAVKPISPDTRAEGVCSPSDLIRGEVVAELSPGDAFGEEAIFFLAEADREEAETLECPCALDYSERRYTATQISEVVELLMVRDRKLLATLLDGNHGELRLRSASANEALSQPPASRSHLQRQSIIRVLETAGIFMKHRLPSKHVLRVLSSCVEFSEAEEGRALYFCGQISDSVYCLLSGAIDMTHHTPATNTHDAVQNHAVRADDKEYELVTLQVNVAGMLVGTIAEAYTDKHEDCEQIVESERESELAKHTISLADREIVSKELDSLRLQEKIVEDALALKAEALTSCECDITMIQGKLQELQNEAQLGGSVDEMSEVLSKLETLRSCALSTREEEMDLKARLIHVREMIEGRDKELHVLETKLHEHEVEQDAKSREGLQEGDAAGTRMRRLGCAAEAPKDKPLFWTLGERFKQAHNTSVSAEPGSNIYATGNPHTRTRFTSQAEKRDTEVHRRSYTAIAVGSTRVLKIPQAAWAEACCYEELFLSFKTLVRQLRSLRSSPLASHELEPQDTSKLSALLGEQDRAPDATSAHTSVTALQKFVSSQMISFLQNVDFLAHLTPPNLLKLALRSTLRDFAPFTVISAQGHAHPSVNGNQVGYVILSGSLSTHKKRAGNAAEVDRWYALLHHLQLSDGAAVRRYAKTFADSTSNANVHKLAEKFQNDPVSAVEDCFGDSEGRMSRGSIVGENILMGTEVKSCSTYVCSTHVWALEVSLKDFGDISSNSCHVVQRPHNAVSILKKAIAHREPRDLKSLHGCLHQIPFFRVFPEKALLELCAGMTLQTLEAGEILFRQQDDAEEMFVVLAGTLETRMLSCSPMKKKDDCREANALDEPGNTFFDVVQNKNSSDERGRNHSSGFFKVQRVAWDITKYGPCTGLRQAGDSIGQALCFIPDAKRSTTVRARSRAKLIVIKARSLDLVHQYLNTRDLFDAHAMAQVLFQPTLRSNDDLLAIGEFLRTLPLLSTLTCIELMTLAKRVEATHSTRGSVIFANVAQGIGSRVSGSELSSLFFLARGCAVLCQADVSLSDEEIQQKNAKFLDSHGIRLSDEHKAQLSWLGVIKHVVRNNDALLHIGQGTGRQALAQLPHTKLHHTYSCMIVEESIVLSLSMEAISECNAEWKRAETEQAHAVLAKTYPFSGWKHRELSVLASHTKMHQYQRGDPIFQRGSVAETLLFVLQGEVALQLNGLSQVVPRDVDDGSIPPEGGGQGVQKAGVQSDTRLRPIVVSTVSAGGLLGLDLILRLDTERAKSIEDSLKEMEVEVTQLQQCISQTQQEANKPSAVTSKDAKNCLAALRTKLAAATKSKQDLVAQQIKVSTEGTLHHKYHGVAASSMVKVLCVRRTDVEAHGHRGSLTILEKSHKCVVDHRTKSMSDIVSNKEAEVSGGMVMQKSRIEAELTLQAKERSAEVVARRKKVGDVRVCAALAGTRAGLLAEEEYPLAPEDALKALMNLRKWMRKKYGKLGTSTTILSTLYASEEIPDEALKFICFESKCGLRGQQLRRAIERPPQRILLSESGDEPASPAREVSKELSDKMLCARKKAGSGEKRSRGTDLQRPDVVYFEDLQRILQDEAIMADAAMRATATIATEDPGEDVVQDPANALSEDTIAHALSPREDREEDRTFRPHSAFTRREKHSPFSTGRPNSARPQTGVELRTDSAEEDLYRLEMVDSEKVGTESLQARNQIHDGKVQSRSGRPTSAKKASSASTVRLAQQNAPMRYIAGRVLQRPQTSMERRSAWMGQTVESEIDAFDGDWQGTLFSSRSAMIEGLKETLSIKTEPAKVALVKPRKLGMLRSEYSAFKGSRPGIGRKTSLAASVEAASRLQRIKMADSMSTAVGSLCTFDGLGSLGIFSPPRDIVMRPDSALLVAKHSSSGVRTGKIGRLGTHGTRQKARNIFAAGAHNGLSASPTGNKRHEAALPLELSAWT